MGKNVEDVKKEIEETIDEAVDNVMDTAEDLGDQVAKTKWYQKINWKRIGKDALIFVGGVLFKTGFDYLTGSKAMAPDAEVPALPEVDTDKVVNF